MAGEVEGIRWGRALLAAVIVEVILGVVAAAAFLASASASTLNLIVPPASFLAALIAVMWLFRNSNRPVANGVAAGVICLLLYVVLACVAWYLAPERVDFSQALGLAYLASHALKIAGGAVGGWLIARRGTAASAGSLE